MGTVGEELDVYVEIPVLIRVTKKQLDTFRFGGYNERAIILVDVLGEAIDGNIKSSVQLGTPLYKTSDTLEENARQERKYSQGDARKGRNPS